METTIQTSHVHRANVSSHTTTSAYTRFIERMQFNHFGIMSMTILVGSMVAGIAAMYILKSDAPIWQLCLCMAAATGNNVSAIAQASTKWVINFFLINMTVNAALILMNLG
jgi:hypothetical protein